MMRADDVVGPAEPAGAAARPEAWTNIELARRIGHMLTTAAEKVGVSYDALGYDFEGLAGQVVAAAQTGGKLRPGNYRAVWRIWDVFRRNPERRATMLRRPCRPRQLLCHNIAKSPLFANERFDEFWCKRWTNSD
jgi:hypothetical protein